MTDWFNGATTYSYDDAGRLTEIDYPNGVAGTLDYDAADRLTEIAYADGMTALETISYVINAVGMRTSMTDSSGTTDFTYDALYRLTEVEYPNSDLTEYGYDAVGNRTSLTLNGGTPTTNTYNAANALTAAGSDSYSYDDSGNLTSKTVGSVTTNYTWDALNRLTGFADGTATASYAYNGDELRVAKTVNSVTTDYTWDQTGFGYVIADGNEFVRGHGLISQITPGATPTYVHGDALGSVRLLTNNLAAVVGTETFDAFGASRTQSGTQLPFAFAGELAEPASGQIYLRARYMDPATGIFVSRDPFEGVLELPVTLHRYLYAAANPINLIDPSGLCFVPANPDKPTPEECREQALNGLIGLGVQVAIAVAMIAMLDKLGLVAMFTTWKGRGLAAAIGIGRTAHSLWLYFDVLKGYEDCRGGGRAGTPGGHYDPPMSPSLPGLGGGARAADGCRTASL